jgi:acyl-CoA synthetase (AMP-forming)/AMP-acid ligase II
MHPGTYAEVAPERAAVVMADGRTLTYGELEAGSNRLAHWFRQQGLRRGDHVALLMENRPELLVVAWAAQRAGLYYTPCSTRLTADEVGYILEDCGARVVIATDAHRPTVDAAPASPDRRLVVGDPAEGWTTLDAAVAGLPATPIADQAEGADMLYSSGTTGRPKGVKPPLREPDYPNPTDLGLAELFELGEDTVFLSPAPLYHAAPLRYSMMVLRIGGTVVVQDRFDAAELLELVARHRVTFAQLVPTMFVRLLKLPDEVRAAADVSSLRAVVHGAAPCPIEVKERIMAWWGPIVHEYYSGTEGNCFVYCDPEGWLAHKGSVGISLGGPVHILDDEGDEVPVGETGLVFFERGGFEYHNDPDKTRDSRDPQGRGWTTLGDIGRVDEDGYLYLTDRRAYTIISGGVNVYPQESEDVLTLHPAVADVAVFGIPDDEMGERVHAVVAPAPDVEPTDALADELIAYCRERLAHYKCPRSVSFRAELPRAATGKLYKRLLKDEFWAGRSLAG